MSQYSVSFSVYSDAKSPFWLAQLVRPDGARVKRSTKVSVARLHLSPDAPQVKEGSNKKDAVLFS